jgi:hypothetical protein
LSFGVIAFAPALASAQAEPAAAPSDPTSAEPAPEPAPQTPETPSDVAAAETAPPPAEQSAEPAPPPEEVPPVEAAPPPAADKPKPPPYSLPWQLRPVVVGNVIRSDTSLAFWENAASGESGTTVVSTLLGSIKLTDSFAPLIRLGVVSNSPPDPQEPATGFMNPVVGGTYSLSPTPELKIGLFLGLTVPIGSGGDKPGTDKNVQANGAGIWARSAMDNAMFAVNDFTVFPGVGIAYVAHGFTAQIEATLLQLTRVKGDDTIQKDSSRTNFTSGLHLGYFLAPPISIGAEIRHQRWLSTPAPVEANSDLRETTTFAVGPRFHLKIGEKRWIRPGISYARGLDKPMTDTKHNMIQLDVPIVL